MISFEEFRKLQSQGRAVVLDPNRKRANNLPLFKAFLKGKVMTPLEISQELDMSVIGTYVALRKYEKTGELFSTFIKNKIHYGSSLSGHSDNGSEKHG